MYGEVDPLDKRVNVFFYAHNRWNFVAWSHQKYVINTVTLNETTGDGVIILPQGIAIAHLNIEYTTGASGNLSISDVKWLGRTSKSNLFVMGTGLVVSTPTSAPIAFNASATLPPSLLTETIRPSGIPSRLPKRPPRSLVALATLQQVVSPWWQAISQPHILPPPYDQKKSHNHSLRSP